MKTVTIVLCVLAVAGCAVSVKEDTYVQDRPTLEEWRHSALAHKGYIVLGSKVSAQMASDIVAMMVTLDEDPQVQRITMVINSNGGEASALRMIYNAMRLTSKPVDTVNIGNCYSAACAIFAGATGKRYAYRNAHFMVHLPQAVGGSPRRLRDALAFEMSFYEAAVRANSHLPEAWFPLTGKDQFFTAQEALLYDFVDELIEQFPSS